MKKGFTLIELLVVISIIGILAALTLTGFNAARKNARDATRKSDLQQYRSALEAYASNNNGKYPYNVCPPPSGCTGNSLDGSTTGLFIDNGPIIPNYLPTKIRDPRNGVTEGAIQYRYRYFQGDNGVLYKLAAFLETGDSWIVCSNGKAGKVANGNVTPDSTCNL